ncbi:uncharacterized protein B0I36DRAFT_416907 [Microdochium trichocladiopsis]|uniref:LysM domain-containing protein n=1 Tax=Microdochium trichocladiopsis TaxID=1682393 RepID=A0A9P8XY65_9PEZI|nr:uncharacterized protein B0I36DRAFT_416907 [Microdochium trichocladiopsis]KAH7024976.1 hypothetical protein B0I36DRAFT_416907 [Microdochium trichocladiopsis]
MHTSHVLIAAAGLLSNAVLAQRALPKRGVDCFFSYTPSKGDTCATFAASWALDVAEFQSLNPGVSCPNLDTSKQYCVLGNVNDDGPATSTSTSTSTKAPTPTTSKTSTTAAPPASSNSPAMPGLAGNCDGFHKIVSGDNCDAISKKYGITRSQFLGWNTEVNKDCTNLWLDYYVCVHVSGAGSGPTTTTTTSKTTTPPTSQPTNSGPQPQMPGIVPSCKKFHLVKDGEGCWAIYTNAGITFEQFRAYNTQIDENCSNMWKDVYVCVGV